MDKRTPLYNAQKALNAKFTSFGGWELPVSYTDILQEHHAVRNNAGLFDVSHMGEILVTGKDSLTFVNSLITNDLSNVPNNKEVYSPMCYDNGTVVDDIIVYKISDQELLLIVNAGNIQKDEDWIKSHARGDVIVENLSDQYVQLALQGPASEQVIKELLDEPADLPGFFWFKNVSISGMKVILSRSGYTGEDGFELYMRLTEPNADADRLWNAILEKGKDKGVVPAGLGARDTLRLEAALPLYGHELSDSITPLEAGLKKFVKLEKEDFIGKEALAEQMSQGLKRKLYGFEMLDRGIPRNGYEIMHNGRVSGYATSGGPLPSIGQNGGLALLDETDLSAEEIIEVVIRERKCRAKIVPIPFCGKKYKK